MKLLKTKRSLAAVGLVVAGTAVPLMTAAPAQATAAQCTSYLQSKGYLVGARIKHGCEIGDGSTGLDVAACKGYLAAIGVRSEHTGEACRRAYN